MVAAMHQTITDLCVEWAKECDHDGAVLPFPLDAEPAEVRYGFLGLPEIEGISHHPLQSWPPDVDRHPFTGWSIAEQAAVISFLQHLSAEARISPAAYADALKNAKDGPRKQGAAIWQACTTLIWQKLKGNQKILAVLKAHGEDLDTLAAVFEEFPAQENLNWNDHRRQIAADIFGESVYTTGVFLRPSVTKFLKRVLSRTRQSWVKAFPKRRQGILRRKGEVLANMEAAMKDPTRFTRSSLVELIKNVHEYHRWAEIGGFESERKVLQQWKKDFETIRRYIAATEDGIATKLPHHLADALPHLLSSGVDRTALQDDITNAISTHESIASTWADVNSMEETEGDAEKHGRLRDLAPWSVGVGEYDLTQLSSKELYSDWLGLSGEKIPGLVDTIKFAGGLPVNDWDHPVKFKDPSGHVEFKLDHRQVVGVVKMMINAFQGKPVLLNDQVGVGKTVEVLAFIATLAWSFDFYSKNGRFPGQHLALAQWPRFKTDCATEAFPGAFLPEPEYTTADVPKHPSLVNVPVALMNTWMNACKTYMKKDFFVLIPISGKGVEATQHVMRQILPSALSKFATNSCRVIVMISTEALRGDFKAVFTKPSNHAGVFRMASVVRLPFASSLWSTWWTCMAIDEAHLHRSPEGYAFHAERALSLKSAFVTAMTATPVMTSATDIVQLARMILAPGFEGNEADSMVKQMNREVRAAKKRVKAANERADPVVTTEALRRKGLGDEELDDDSRELLTLLQTQCAQLRATLDDLIIRRENVFDPATMPPEDKDKYPPEPIIKEVLVRMYDKEFEALNERFVDLASQNLKPSSCFYTEIRQMICHYRYKSGGFPASEAEYKADAGAKLDAAVKIIRHHLATNNARPLRVASTDTTTTPGAGANTDTQGDVRMLVEDHDNAEWSSDVHPKAPVSDKVLLFARFHTLHGLIKRRLKLAGINVLSLTGKESTVEKQATLDKFLTSNDARVLIVSAVALAGLNIQHACILIVLDVLWSAQEVEQLMGRLVRRGQLKKVIVYHIIASGTTDVALNNICFDKSALLDGFKAIPGALKEFLEAPEPGLKSIEEYNSDDDGDGDGSQDRREESSRPARGKKTTSTKPKAKAKARAPPKPKATSQPKPKGGLKAKAEPKSKASKAENDGSKEDRSTLSPTDKGKSKVSTVEEDDSPMPVAGPSRTSTSQPIPTVTTATTAAHPTPPSASTSASGTFTNTAGGILAIDDGPAHVPAVAAGLLRPVSIEASKPAQPSVRPHLVDYGSSGSESEDFSELLAAVTEDASSVDVSRVPTPAPAGPSHGASPAPDLVRVESERSIDLSGLHIDDHLMDVDSDFPQPLPSWSDAQDSLGSSEPPSVPLPLSKRRGPMPRPAYKGARAARVNDVALPASSSSSITPEVFASTPTSLSSTTADMPPSPADTAALFDGFDSPLYHGAEDYPDMSEVNKSNSTWTAESSDSKKRGRSQSVASPPQAKRQQGHQSEKVLAAAVVKSSAPASTSTHGVSQKPPRRADLGDIYKAAEPTTFNLPRIARKGSKQGPAGNAKGK